MKYTYYIVGGYCLGCVCECVCCGGVCLGVCGVYVCVLVLVYQSRLLIHLEQGKCSCYILYLA